MLIFLPVLGNEVGIVVEGIQNVRVEDGLARQLSAEFVASDELTTDYLTLGQMQDDFVVIHIQSVRPPLDDGPAITDVALDSGSIEK